MRIALHQAVLAVAPLMLCTPGSAAPQAGAAPSVRKPTVYPAQLKLVAPDPTRQVAVTAPPTALGVEPDLTAAVRYRVLDPTVAEVTAQGLVRGLRNGATTLEVQGPTGAVRVPVSVSGLRPDRAYQFASDIMPILSRAGCNSGPCHGKAEGQGGFRLSVFAYNPDADFQALTADRRGRRVNLMEPARSLVLLKATGRIPHAGGIRFREKSESYRILSDWIAAGCPQDSAHTAPLQRLSIWPPSRTAASGARHQVVVTAHYADGSTRDVTRWARYGTNNPGVASVDENGVVLLEKQVGEAAVMAQYDGKVAASRFAVPRSTPPVAMAAYPTPQNFIDRAVWQKLQRLRILPSDAAADGRFLRRVFVDTIGVLPTPDEARQFLAECDAERSRKTGDRTPFETRAKWVDKLLDRPEYADLWALKWSDILRVNKEKLGAKGAHAFYSWIRESIAANVPFDQFVRTLVTASGSSEVNGAVNYFRVVDKPEAAASAMSQVLLGVRIECAQCHHHPFEKWSQEDFYGLTAYFARLQQKGISGGAFLASAPSGETVHPKTKQPVAPRPLGEQPVAGEAEDRRTALADWLCSPRNPFLSKMLANRLWAHFMGRGLVEPVDDFRDTNPPSNPELLRGLSQYLVDQKFDVKKLIRTIVTSRAYQLDSVPNATNRTDEQNYSRAYPRRMSAEVLMDSIASATGAPLQLPGLPRGTRAVQIWDSEWYLPWQSYFLAAFGRPARTSPCECERSQEPTIAQVLHLMNAPEIQAQLSSRTGRIRAQAAAGASRDRMIEEIFLAAYSRRPTAREKAAALKTMQAPGADFVDSAEDILWALMNTVEFVFVQ